jgi:hypothetical protein
MVFLQEAQVAGEASRDAIAADGDAVAELQIEIDGAGPGRGVGMAGGGVGGESSTRRASAEGRTAVSGSCWMVMSA